MKHMIIQIAVIAAALATISCSKEYVSPEDLVKHPSKVATTSFKTKADLYEDTDIPFKDMTVYRKSDKEGKSWFCAHSGGRMVYDAFMLSLYFDCIDTLKIGDIIEPDRCMFSFFYSSDSNATTHEYQGSIKLADKGKDFAVFHFDKVIFTCSFGEYIIDGYLNCPLLGEYMTY